VTDRIVETRARLGDAFQPRLDFAVTDLGPTQLKNIAEPIHVYSLEVGQPAQAKPAAVAPSKAAVLALDFDGATHRINHAAKLDNCAIAGAFDDAPVMHGEDRIDQVAAQRSQPGKDAIFVRSSKPRVADDVGDQDRRQFPRLAHGASADVARSLGRGGLSTVRFHAALAEGVEAGSASLRVDRPVYPRRG
jgi:hypothetical protein